MSEKEEGSFSESEVPDEKMLSLVSLSDEQWFASLSDKEINYYKQNKPDVLKTKLCCTSCMESPGITIKDFFSCHPLLGVPICKKCKKFFFSGTWRKDEEGFYEYCCWCGHGGDLVMCSRDGCSNVFCKNCIKRNLGRHTVTQIDEADSWDCFECKPKQIRTLRAMCYAVYEYCKSLKYEPQKYALRIKVNPSEDDLVGKTLKDVEDVAKIFSEFVDSEVKSHFTKAQQEVIMDKDYVRKRSRRLAKLVNATRLNLDKMFEFHLNRVQEQFPELDLDELRELANAEEDKTSGEERIASTSRTTNDVVDGKDSQNKEKRSKIEQEKSSIVNLKSNDGELETDKSVPEESCDKTTLAISSSKVKEKVYGDLEMDESSSSRKDGKSSPESDSEIGMNDGSDLAQEVAKLNESLSSRKKITGRSSSESEPKDLINDIEPKLASEPSEEFDENLTKRPEIAHSKTDKSIHKGDPKADDTTADVFYESSNDIADNNFCDGDIHKVNDTNVPDIEMAELSDGSSSGELMRTGKKNQKSKLELQKLLDSAQIVPRSEIDVGMVAPSADAISKQDLEDEKIKLAVLKSTSPSNSSDNEDDSRPSPVKHKHLKTKSQLDLIAKKLLSNRCNFDDEGACDNIIALGVSDLDENDDKNLTDDEVAKSSDEVILSKKSVKNLTKDVFGSDFSENDKNPNVVDGFSDCEKTPKELPKVSKVSQSDGKKSPQKSEKSSNKSERSPQKAEKLPKKVEKTPKQGEKSPKKGEKGKESSNELDHIRAKVLLTSSSEDEAAGKETEIKKGRKLGKQLRRRFDKLVSQIDAKTDVKLNKKKPKVVIKILPKDVSKDLSKNGIISLLDFPKLNQAEKDWGLRVRNPQSEEAKFDAEIDRLCNLGALEHINRKIKKEIKVPTVSKPGKLSVKSKEKELRLSDISSGSEHDNDSDSETATSTPQNKFDNINPKPLDEVELAKLAVLASSSEDENNQTDSEVEKKVEKKVKLVKKKKIEKEQDATMTSENEIADEESSRSQQPETEVKKKSKRNDPGFLRVKLSDTDEDKEEEKARKRVEKRDLRDKSRRLNDSSSDDEIISPLKSSPTKRKTSKVVDDSDEESDDENSDDAKDDGDDGSDWSGANDKKSKKKGKNHSSDSDIAPKKRKSSKRKKKSGSDDNDDDKDDMSDEDEPRTKKKRRRIKKTASSSEEGDKAEDGSPTKRRHKIRKIIKDADLSKTTKEADREERDRRKRMDERQQLYNKTFELTHDSLLKELPLDFDPETKKILVEVDKSLVKKMKPHQGGGIKFMWDACFETKKDVLEDRVPGGAILGHCMGLGKTLQTIGLVHTVMKNFPNKVKCILILCPVNTIKNWCEEFEKWLSEEQLDDVQEVHDGSLGKDTFERMDRLKHWKKNGGCMIMGYDMYRNLTNTTARKFKAKQQQIFQEALVNPGPDIVICDEGHILKNVKSALNIAINKINTRRRIILTGTPLQNNLTEYFAMVDFVKPQLLGSYAEFKNRFVNPIQAGQHSDSTERDVRIMKKRSFILCDLLKGCMQRLDYNVLTPYLQPKYEYVLCLCLTDLQKKLYSFYLDNYARAGQIGDEGKMEGGKKGGLFYDVQNLGRIWNHPCILLMAKERSDLKRMNDDDEEEFDEEGSLKDFVVDESEESTPNSSSHEDGGDSDIEMLTESKSSTLASLPGRTTRGERAKNQGQVELFGGLDEVKKETLARSRGWWGQFLPDSNDEGLMKLEHGVKMIMLMDILRECEILGDKVLVFSQSLLSLDLIETFLKLENDRMQRSEITEETGYFGSWLNGIDYYRMDGSTPPENRKKWCNFFNKKTNLRTRLFLISTKAGGLGINLVSANRVIIFDASWNPAHDVQSIFRVYRFGQEKPVYIYRFLAKGTMEEKIYDRQVTKQSLSARVVDEQQIERHFSMNELSELYEYKDEPIEQRPVPKVPKDRLLAELLAKHPEKIWKYHDHDSLLENQVDENLTEEERKAAWEEFENEKKGISSIVGNPAVNNVANFNLNVEEIASQYRIQYPHLTDDQVIQATRAYIMQIQSAFTRKPAYDKSHYQQEMARARGIQQQMYPGMFRGTDVVERYRAAQLQQANASGSSNGSASAADIVELQREAIRNKELQQQLLIKNQMLNKQRAQQMQRGLPLGGSASQSQQASAAPSDDDDEITVLGDESTISEPISRPSGSGLSSRRGRPRLDPESDPLV